LHFEVVEYKFFHLLEQFRHDDALLEVSLEKLLLIRVIVKISDFALERFVVVGVCEDTHILNL